MRLPFSPFTYANQMEDLALLTRHLAGSLAARSPLPQVLRAYAAENEGGRLRGAILEVSSQVESGIPLSNALERHPRIFPEAYRRLVRLGEEGKSLASVMGQLADTLEDGLRSYEFMRRAAMYPLLVLVTMFVILGFIETTIMPKYDAIMKEMGSYEEYVSHPTPEGERTPPENRDWIQTNRRRTTQYAMFGLLVPIAIFLGAAYGFYFPWLGYGRFVLQLPLIGGVLRRAEAARFAGQLAVLLENRVPMHEALGLLSQAAGNPYVRDAIRNFQQRSMEGESLGSMLATQPLFPAGMSVLVSSAQEHGRLPETLRGLARFHHERTAHGIAVMREFIEPLLLILVAFIVMMTLAALYFPLFNLPNAAI